MLSVMRSWLLATITSTVVFALSSMALADCTAPSSPGVRICAPTPNATMVYTPMIDFNSTPSPAAYIVQFKIYDNGHLTVTGLANESGGLILDGSMKQGFHNVVINVWDSSGRLFQGKISFIVIANGGNGFPFTCPLPGSPGINFCVPTAGSVLGVSYQVTASATATSGHSISAMRLYVDGKAEDTQYNTRQFPTGAFTGTQGNHTIAVVAWDTSGHVFSNTRILNSAFTWDYVSCPPKGTGTCSPGFDTTLSPIPNSYVGNSFELKADIQNNPAPITAVKAYIDNTLVATSTGPLLLQTVSNAPSGTHFITFQGWDTRGILYRVQYNVNINVPH
ncbi:MAG TPA: hypothetical protein VN577_07165 [Terriglobales bacterium]|nr:hypothetical protein [Terriglobales bacterium]